MPTKENIIKKRKCVICGKILKWNFDKQYWECPKIKVGRDRKVGCGFIHKLTEREISRR